MYKTKAVHRKSLDFDIMDYINCIPGHAYCKDKDGVYLWSNDGQLKTFGLTDLSQILGKTDFDLFDPVTAQRLREVDLRIINSGKAEILEEECALGSISTNLSYKAPIRNKKGEIIGIIGNAIDISTQHKARQRLATEHLNKTMTLENIVINLPAHIYWKDSSGKILGCNDKSAISFGLQHARELIGKTIFDLVDRESARKVHNSDLNVMRTGQTEVIEEQVLYKGKKYTFISHKSPFNDHATGETLGILGVSIDITKQKELEQAHKEQAIDLAQALEVKEDFLNNMSHEVRTPLQGFVGMADALEGAWDQTTDEVKRNCIRGLLESRDRLMSLLSNLLDLAELKKGRSKFSFKYYDIKMLIIEVITEFQYITQPIELKVESNVNVYICCDEWRLKQVLRNVIANAVKHGGKDKPIVIMLSAQDGQNNKYLKIAIQDEGLGVPEEELEAIFDSFHESKRTKRMSGGTGIGLALCRNIIEAHKGAMWVENNKAVGSTFFITIPYEKPSAQVYTFRLTRQS